MKKINVRLYLDISSTNSGVVIFREDTQEILLDSINLTELKKPSLMPQVDFEKIKIGCIRDYFETLKERYNITEVHMEGIFIQPKFLKSSEILLKIHGFLMGYFLDTPQFYEPPANIKKFITGKGNATKDKVQEAVEKRYNYKFRNSDECDAFALFLTKNGHNTYTLKEEEKYD